MRLLLTINYLWKQRHWVNQILVFPLTQDSTPLGTLRGSPPTPRAHKVILNLQMLPWELFDLRAGMGCWFGKIQWNKEESLTNISFLRKSSVCSRNICRNLLQKEKSWYFDFQNWPKFSIPVMFLLTSSLTHGDLPRGVRDYVQNQKKRYSGSLRVNRIFTIGICTLVPL